MSPPLAGSVPRQIRLFGPPAAFDGETALALPEKGFVLLALLGFAERNELDRDTVRALLWEGAPAARRAGNLRQLLLRLNRLTGVSLVTAMPSGRLRLVADAWRIDAVDLLRPEPTGAAAPPLDTGALLEGVAVDGEAFEEWLGATRRKVHERRIAVLRARLERPDLGARDRAALARTLVACDPVDEAGYRALMAAHAELGDRQAARTWWLECRRRLHEDLRVQPAAETGALAARLELDGPAAAAPRPSEAPGRADPAGIPTVVVMPPATLPGNALLDRLGFVILEEITLGLSHFGSFRIIAAHTSWHLSKRDRVWPGDGPDPFDYAVTVGIRSSEEPLRATCRLTKLSTGEVLWAAELEVQATNLHASLAELVRSTVKTLAAAVERAEGRGSPSEPDSSGYRMYLEGKRFAGAHGLESIRAARKWFKAALKRSDDFSAALAGLSRTLSMEWLVRGMTDGELLDDALAAAKRAHGCDPASGRALREIGFTSLYLRRHEESLACFSQARALAPHDADLLADYADALCHDGQSENALELMQGANRLNPIGPDHYKWIEASILYQLEDYEGAIQVLRPIAESPATARLMAASCAMAGDRTAARRHAAIVRENYPNFRIEQVWRNMPDRRPADTRQLVLGLQRAGLD